MLVYNNVLYCYLPQMKLFSCLSIQSGDESNKSEESISSGCFPWLNNQEQQPVPRSSLPSEIPKLVGHQSSYDSLNNIYPVNRLKIFPEYIHYHNRSQISRHSRKSMSRRSQLPHRRSQHSSQQSYRVSPSFPPPPCSDEDYYDENFMSKKNNHNHVDMNMDVDNNMDIDAFLQEFNQDMEFIENIAREIMKAKRAIDDEIYQELQRRRP
jgi:hypothetical protein